MAEAFSGFRAEIEGHRDDASDSGRAVGIEIAGVGLGKGLLCRDCCSKHKKGGGAEERNMLA